MDEEKLGEDGQARKGDGVEECSPRAEFWLRVAWGGANLVPWAMLALVAHSLTCANRSPWASADYHPSFNDRVTHSPIQCALALLGWFCCREAMALQRQVARTYLREGALRGFSYFLLLFAFAMAWDTASTAARLYLDPYPGLHPDLWFCLGLAGFAPAVVVLATLVVSGLRHGRGRRCEQDDAPD